MGSKKFRSQCGSIQGGPKQFLQENTLIHIENLIYLHVTWGPSSQDSMYCHYNTLVNKKPVLNGFFLPHLKGEGRKETCSSIQTKANCHNMEIAAHTLCGLHRTGCKRKKSQCNKTMLLNIQ